MLADLLIYLEKQGTSARIILEQSYVTKDKLNSAIWDEEQSMHPEVKKTLLQLGRDFYDELEIDATIFDIQLTGSSANYNWTEYSDVDVHVLIDFKDVNDDEKLVKKAMDNIRWRWNMQHSPMVGDHEVELYVQDVKEPHVASGLYSLMKDEWLVIPTPKSVQVDLRDVEIKADAFRRKIVELEKADKSEQTLNGAVQLKDKIQLMRKSGLAEGGEFSVENLAFKDLRNGGYIARLVDLINETYDALHSVPYPAEEMEGLLDRHSSPLASGAR